MEFSLIGPIGLQEEPARPRPVATFEGPSSREAFISQCTSQSLVVWRHATRFGAVQALPVDHVHSPLHEEPDAPIDDHLARSALAGSV